MPRAVAWASCPCLAPVHVSRNRAQSGAALILVLASLIFISALTVAFLVSMRSKLAISKSGSDASEVKMLAETAVNVAISQVRDATKKAGANNLAWASQPGMIRLYDNSGNAAGYYKLYSADNMVATSGAFNSGTNAPSDPVPTAWADNPAVYTDLNAPANGVFPILDATAATALGVQGFSLNSPPTTGTTNPAPMPVKWLYVLEDGSLHAPDSTSSGTKAVISEATPQNPIVGRVAFWADDETCKVNINTASEYFYWEAPSTYSSADVTRAIFQPGSDEYQRYPGHPTTTCLSAVFEKLGPASSLETDAQRAARYQKAFNLAPRITGTIDGKPYTGGLNAGGSQAGTVVSWLGLPAPSLKLVLDSDRLYATEGDFLYDPTRAEQLVSQGVLNNTADLQRRLCFLTAHSTSPDTNWMNQPRISLWPLNPNETSKWSAFDKVLAYCGTINTLPYYFQRTDGFDPSKDFNGAGVYSQRNRSIYYYLKHMLDTPIPGAAGKIYSSKASRNSQQLLTNIFDYIRCCINFRYSGGYTGSGVNAQDDPAKSYYFPPGQSFGAFGCFAAAPTVINDTQTGITTRGPGGYPVVSDVVLHFWAVKPGETNPSSQTTDYPGAIPVSGTITRTIQMNLLLNLCNMQGNDNLPSPQYQIQVSGPGWSITSGPDSAQDATVIPPSGPMNFPSPGGSVMRVYSPHNSRWDFSQQGGFVGLEWLYRGADNPTDSFTGTHDFQTRVFSRTPAANTFTFYSDPINLSIPIGSAIPIGGGATIARQGYKDEGKKTNASLIDPTAKPAMMNFNGGNITIKIFPGIKTNGTAETDSYDLSTTTPIQTITVTVPSCTLPVPVLGDSAKTCSDAINYPNSLVPYYDFGSWINRGKYPRLETYISTCGYNNEAPWLMDVVRGVTLDPSADHKGDLRVLANSQNIPSSWYAADYTGTSREFLVASCISYSSMNGGTNFAKLDSTASYNGYVSARVAAPTLNGMNRGGVANVGDFINGRGNFGPGGYYIQSDMGYEARSVNPSYPPYFSQEFPDARALSNALTYSPARMVGSPIILGKLSTFVSESIPNPWETLLFCANPQGGNVSHHGWDDPKDHYLLDLFQMPIVEPYAISQPLNTDGRVNLNHQIVPFGYINRSTALYAAIKGTRAYAFPDKNLVKWNAPGSAPKSEYTVAIDVPQTIAQIDLRAPFITASEFTEVSLIPEGAGITTKADAIAYWKSMAGTGDDLREAPYNHIYPKLTTKSNTFTVHMRVQALKQVSNRADWATWNEATDQVVSEYRGSAGIERYVDPNDTTIPDFTLPANYTKNLAPYYRWRTVSERQFLP